MESRGGEFLLLSYPGLPTYTVKKQHMVRPSLSPMKPAKAYRVRFRHMPKRLGREWRTMMETQSSAQDFCIRSCTIPCLDAEPRSTSPSSFAP